MRRKWLSLLIITCFLSFMLSGCEKSPDAEAASEPEPSQDLPASTGMSVLPSREEKEDAAEPAPEPEPEPEPTEEEKREAFLRGLIAGMDDAALAGQMVFTACPTSGAEEMIRQVQPGGLILLGNNIDGETKETLSKKLSDFQNASLLPLLIAADEEGGTVCRISTHPEFRASRFRSPRKLLASGGIEALREETQEKTGLLTSLGINVNLAPVCDLAQDEDSFMYSRAVPGTPQEAAGYIAEMVEIMESGGLGTVLKHFPGYGENGDTHILSESTLYTILKRLEAAHMLTVKMVEYQGRLRKYYSITEQGRERIEAFKDEWKEIVSIYEYITREEKNDE